LEEGLIAPFARTAPASGQLRFDYGLESHADLPRLRLS
jgi:hypothetical protein